MCTRHCFRLPRLASITGVILVGGLISVSAHNGFVIPAPTNASPMITIDGTKGEAAWGAGTSAVPLPNTCDEFTMGTGSPLMVFATKDASNFYLAFSIPDTSPSALDRLLVFFDANHAAGAALQADDVAYDFPFGATTAPITNAKKFTGVSPSWTQSATFPATVQAAYTRSATELVVELEIPTTEIAAPANAGVGFAFVYLNQTAVECPSAPGELAAFKAVWPPSLTFPPGTVTLPDNANHPSAWGDLGKDVGTVKFTAPPCCSNPDIQFLGISGTTFLGDSDVPIIALAHPENMFDSKNVNVEIKVHRFGTGGGDIFNSTQTIGLVPHTAPAIGVPTIPATWHTPNETFHACVQALILPPTSPDDYAIGTNALAQKNADVVEVKKAMLTRLEFVTFNPDRTTAQTIRLASVQRGPRMDGLTFEVVQPDRPLGPLQEATVALVANVAANTPTSDVPRQRIHVPQTAGRTDAVLLEAKPGDRFHLTATGGVDIDGDGRAPSTGPDGVDVSNVFPEGQFLLKARSASRVGGALIGSVDGFETAFLIGAATTVTIPEKSQGLRLAVNDLVDRNGDNTGSGFDVVAWTLPPVAQPAPDRPIPVALALAPPPFPEVHIAATTFQQIKVAGVDKPYNVPSNLGAVTYQLLVTDQGATTPPGGGQKYWVWLILLIVLVIAVLLVLKRRKTA
jgi:hypothetical protein